MNFKTHAPARREGATLQPNTQISPIPPEFTDENALAGDAAESEAALALRHPLLEEHWAWGEKGLLAAR
jgi:hypothetical protein